MKIPKHIHLASKDFQNWREKAQELSMEYGMFIELIYTNRNNQTPELESVQFKVMDHVFEGLKDLRKALDNRAFL
jgi:hypothetical protein